MIPRRSTFAVAAVAAALGVAAPGCGGSGDRDDPEQSNEGDLESQGGQSTTQDPASGITPTGEEQPSVTQPEGGG